MHMVPEGFVFPTCSAKNMWYRWYLGQQSQNIGPFRRLVSRWRTDIPTSERHKLDKANKVMVALEQIARHPDNAFLAPSEVISATNCGAVFDQAYEILVSQLYPTVRSSFRSHDIIYTTLCNRFPRAAATVIGAEEETAAAAAAAAAVEHN